MNEHIRIEFPYHDPTISQSDCDSYFRVVSRAFAVHLDRERIRQGLWKDYPAVDQCNQIKVKIDRVLRSLELMPPPEAGELTPAGEALRNNILEELPDIINYAIFAHRILEEKI